MKLLNLSKMVSSSGNGTLIRLLDTVQLSCQPGETVTQEPCPFYCLIYIQSGSGRFPPPLEHSEQQKSLGTEKTAVLPAGSLLFLSCENRLHLSAMDSGLEAWIFYLTGDALPLYYDMIINHFANIRTILPDSTSFSHLCFFMQLKHSSSLPEEFLCNKHTVNLLSEYMIQEDTSSLLPRIPSYLLRIKDDFDLHYSRFFSLEDLASSYHTNRYQLCRDFSKYYGMPPIKYLNHIRIQNACTLLATGDMHIGEVGTAVGIENTNHFIRLFKAQMNLSPLQYRKSVFS